MFQIIAHACTRREPPGSYRFFRLGDMANRARRAAALGEERSIWPLHPGWWHLNMAAWAIWTRASWLAYRLSSIQWHLKLLSLGAWPLADSWLILVIVHAFSRPR